MNVIYLLGIVGFVISILALFISWQVHGSMTRDSCPDWGFASFKTFKTEFDKCDWDNEHYKGSLWDRENKSEYHASIIKINNHGMVMRNPLGWLRVMLYVRRYNTRTYPRYNWTSRKADE